MLIIQEILGYFLIGFIGMVCLAILFLPILCLSSKKCIEGAPKST